MFLFGRLWIGMLWLFLLLLLLLLLLSLSHLLAPSRGGAAGCAKARRSLRGGRHQMMRVWQQSARTERPILDVIITALGTFPLRWAFYYGRRRRLLFSTRDKVLQNRG